VHRRKAEPEQRTREEIEEDIFKEKVEFAKSKLKVPAVLFCFALSPLLVFMPLF